MSDWQEEGGQGGMEGGPGGGVEEGGTAESEGWREDAPNPTQEAIDEEGPSDQPVDVGGWEENEPSPHAGEEGQEPV